MTEVAGRPIFAALQMLLSAERLFTLPDKQRLPAILAESRKYQNLVSTKLAEQVLAALYELLRGFQAADDQRQGDLLRDVLTDDPNQVYAGLLTVLHAAGVHPLRRGPRAALRTTRSTQNYYSVIGLFERLREDAGRYPDTMDQRYGAWAQLLTLFRLIYDGGRHGGLKLPARKGYLFDPDRYPFLEGRPQGSTRQPGERTEPPRVSDGVVFRVLQNLLILDGERLSYRTLDVEQIGSVYETIMGFDLEVAQGRSIAIKPTKPHGAPTTINLEELLAAKPADRAKWLKEQTDQALTGQAADRAEGRRRRPRTLVAALEQKVAARHARTSSRPGRWCSSRPTSAGGPARTTRRGRSPSRSSARRSGRSWSDSARTPTPEQILDLKVCDPAMGSGAFLVEACRQLADALVKAWHVHELRADDPARRGRAAPRPPARRPALPVRRGQEPDGGRPGQAVALAGDAGEGPPVHVPRPCPAVRRFAGRADAGSRSLGFHWKPEKQRDFARAAIEGQLNRALRAAPADPRSARRRRPKRCCASGSRPPTGSSTRSARYGDLVVSAFFAARQRPEAQGAARDRCRPSLAAQRSQFDVEPPAAARGGRRRASRRTTPGHPVSLGDRVPRGVRPRESGVRCVRGQSAVRGQEHAHRRASQTAISTGSRRSTRSRTATPTSWPTSSAARSTCCGTRGPSA